ncbi:hypothetical protein SAMN02982929_06267 [Saccharopolyspora kobensis]|uniref:Excreted virulence factor EspC (Type VII ESX diderm) n=1 Tax=Saccharopolyspora kobensis TaxID=146035 RepID=A0A1H6EEN6_9PSEU|nr:hypothetical protein [Saccharopolyspora kobensis]SEG95733.1 hypothetical protein SAMN02982929_06267 [Saccharopolyspora kobensis]SFD53704.1 hypothetical protein SAMN05216506_10518 [Saccharopolyspora kobensis]
MPGYRARPDAITSCGDNVGALSGDAKSIKDKATAAEVPQISWGLLGSATTYSAYTELLSKFQQHLDEMAEGLTRAGEDISACGRDYRNTDRELAESLNRISVDAGGDR